MLTKGHVLKQTNLKRETERVTNDRNFSAEKQFGQTTVNTTLILGQLRLINSLLTGRAFWLGNYADRRLKTKIFSMLGYIQLELYINQFLH